MQAVDGKLENSRDSFKQHAFKKALTYMVDYSENVPQTQSDANGGRERGPPILSIIIPHFNDLDNLKECVGLLGNQTASPETYEIIVADNNSSCGLAAVMDACKERAKVVPAPIQGAGPARNAAIAEAQGRFLAFIDSDCLPNRNWVETGINRLTGSEMVGGNVEVLPIDPQRPTPVELYELIFAFDNKTYVESKGFSITANMFVRRDIFARVGPFRSGVSEDLDWGRRAVALGFKWRYDAELIIRHPARHDWKALERKLRRINNESYMLACESRGGKFWWIIRSWLSLVTIGYDTIRLIGSSKVTRADQKLSAWCVLLRVRLWRFLEANRIALHNVVTQ